MEAMAASKRRTQMIDDWRRDATGRISEESNKLKISLRRQFDSDEDITTRLEVYGRSKRDANEHFKALSNSVATVSFGDYCRDLIKDQCTELSKNSNLSLPTKFEVIPFIHSERHSRFRGETPGLKLIAGFTVDLGKHVKLGHYKDGKESQTWVRPR
jgi:hypothetical protein